MVIYYSLTLTLAIVVVKKALLNYTETKNVKLAKPCNKHDRNI